MSTGRQNSTPVQSGPAGDQPRERDELVKIGIRLLDDAHDVWQRAELECEDALRTWRERSSRTDTEGYLSYLAALDREQAAAGDLQRLWELASSAPDPISAATALTTGELAS